MWVGKTLGIQQQEWQENRESILFSDPEAISYEKTPMGAAIRSLIAPGWGQAYSDKKVSASVWFGANTVAEIDGGVRVEDAIGANAGSYTTTTINFTGSNHFAPGDIVGVSIKPRLNPGKINLTCIWEFDKTIFWLEQIEQPLPFFLLTITASHSWSSPLSHFHQTFLFEPLVKLFGNKSPFFVECHCLASSA